MHYFSHKPRCHTERDLSRKMRVRVDESTVQYSPVPCTVSCTVNVWYECVMAVVWCWCQGDGTAIIDGSFIAAPHAIAYLLKAKGCSSTAGATGT
jgi:hypothetical protein